VCVCVCVCVCVVRRRAYWAVLCTEHNTTFFGCCDYLYINISRDAVQYVATILIQKVRGSDTCYLKGGYSFFLFYPCQSQHRTYYLPVRSKCKSKFVYFYAMRADRGNRGIAPLILYLGTGWRVKLTPRSLYPRDRTQVPIE
jgi:hypothetical protein